MNPVLFFLRFPTGWRSLRGLMCFWQVSVVSVHSQRWKVGRWSLHARVMASPTNSAVAISSERALHHWTLQAGNETMCGLVHRSMQLKTTGLCFWNLNSVWFQSVLWNQLFSIDLFGKESNIVTVASQKPRSAQAMWFRRSVLISTISKSLPSAPKVSWAQSLGILIRLWQSSSKHGSPVWSWLQNYAPFVSNICSCPRSFTTFYIFYHVLPCFTFPCPSPWWVVELQVSHHAMSQFHSDWFVYVPIPAYVFYFFLFLFRIEKGGIFRPTEIWGRRFSVHDTFAALQASGLYKGPNVRVTCRCLWLQAGWYLAKPLANVALSWSSLNMS